MTASSKHPDEVLADLKAAKGKRAHRNFDVLHDVCREISARKGPKDFSPSHVGALTQQRGGPAKNTLLAVQGRHFRTLIDAWASFTGVDPVKPAVSVEKDDDVLSRIEDPILRSYIRPIIHANRRLRAENNTLRALTNVTIDRRPHVTAHGPNAAVRSIAAPNLMEVERQALAVFEDPKKLATLGLKIGSGGEVMSTRPIPTGADVLPLSFVDAVRKLIASIPAR